MGLSWTIVFSVLVIGFIIIPGIVFLTNISRIRKEQVRLISVIIKSEIPNSPFPGLWNSFLSALPLNDLKAPYPFESHRKITLQELPHF